MPSILYAGAACPEVDWDKGESPDTHSLPKKRTRILLADDHASFRKSLKILVESNGRIEVVGQARNGLEAVRMAGDLRPEVVVMDMAMPLLNGLEATRQMMRAFPATRVLILSAHPDPEYIKQAMTFGASGYLIKQSSTHVLGEAVRESVRGNCYFSSSLPKDLRDEMRMVFAKAEVLRKKRAARHTPG